MGRRDRLRVIDLRVSPAAAGRASGSIEGREPPIVEDEQLHTAERPQQAGVTAIAAGARARRFTDAAKARAARLTRAAATRR